MQKKIGRPEKEFKWDVLDGILQYNATLKDSSEILGVSEDTVERRIRKEWDMTFSEYRDRKRSKVRIKLAQKQFEVAMQGNVALLIWLGKQWLGQSDKQEVSNYQDIKIERHTVKSRKDIEATGS